VDVLGAILMDDNFFDNEMRRELPGLHHIRKLE
jgi:hypothetical protein